MQQRFEDFLPRCSLSTVSSAKLMWGRGLSLKTSVGAGAGAVISPSVFVSSSMTVAVASLALSCVGAIFWLRVFVFALCAGGPSGFGRPPVAQICRSAAAGLRLCFESTNAAAASAMPPPGREQECFFASACHTRTQARRLFPSSRRLTGIVTTSALLRLRLQVCSARPSTCCSRSSRWSVRSARYRSVAAFLRSALSIICAGPVARATPHRVIA